LTAVSEGNDFRRLLETSKAGEFVVGFLAGHDVLHLLLVFPDWQQVIVLSARAKPIVSFSVVQEGISLMPLFLTSGPVLEPVSLDEAKLHLRVDHGDEDLLIASLITAARVHLETHLGLAFITQQWSLVLDQWPAGADLCLPLSPVQAVSALTLYDADDASSVVASANYALDAISQPARLVWREGAVRPMPGRSYNGIEVSFSAGFGALASDVPQPLRQAILLLTAHWYERREPVGLANEVREIPQMVLMLTNSYRRVRL